MRCDDARTMLDDYLDGGLAADERAAVAAHLQSCPACAADLEATTRLTEQLAALAPTVEPPRDLWPGIAGRLAPAAVVRGRFGWRRGRRWLAAAAAVLAALAALLLAYTSGRQHGTVRTVVLREATPLALPAGLDDAGFTAAAAEFREARDQLLASLADRRGSLSPETLQVVDENLRVIDGSIERISSALADDPNNPRLANRLASAYRRQIDLLTRANRLPAET